MPQASDELRAKFPGHDEQAINVMKHRFRMTRHGVWCIDKEPTAREWDALDYLVEEWDYAWVDQRETLEIPKQQE